MLRVVSRIKLEVHSLCGSVYGSVVSGLDIDIPVFWRAVVWVLLFAVVQWP